MNNYYFFFKFIIIIIIIIIECEDGLPELARCMSRG